MAHFALDGDASKTESMASTPSQPNKNMASPTPASQVDASLLGDKEQDKEKDKEREKEKEKEKEKGKEKEKEKEKKDKDKDKDNVAIEELSLPKSIITRLAKGVLPSNTQIQGDAVKAMTRSATVFISHLASAANDHTMAANKKTIMPADVFDALDDVEFSSFREQLEAEFKKFNDTQTSKRTMYRRKVAAQKKADKSTTSVTSAAGADGTSDSLPRGKKQKRIAAHDDSTMDIDGDETQEPADASDAETEPEQEEDEDESEDDEEDEGDHDPEEEEEEEENENKDEDVNDRLEERQRPNDDDDNSEDSD
ncbi:histone-fold-containing protein [Xylaria sp. CBS 124048]|nr:histone-fold-containing protein [Xylaria sp. CBS 124048]